tara:strand:+ start:1213 stop:1470 length:258 start_codon:yes stop_codon:yes gene_type:complete
MNNIEWINKMTVFSPTIEYLEQEKERHRNDEMTARGKVAELDELLNRLEHTCDECGKYIYPEYNDKTIRLIKHKEEHQEEKELND